MLISLVIMNNVQRQKRVILLPSIRTDFIKAEVNQDKNHIKGEHLKIQFEQEKYFCGRETLEFLFLLKFMLLRGT